ncbi:hypothetical protein [uncultured Corynebacterium sp.]|nr:hypothetical protein [uncultured Corynebacterium sp.]
MTTVLPAQPASPQTTPIAHATLTPTQGDGTGAPQRRKYIATAKI